MSRKKLTRFAGILVKHEDKFLLCKRSPHQSAPNIWSVPGGGMEDDEKPKDCAIREFYEETNIDLSEEQDNIKLIDVIGMYDNDGRVKGMMYIYLFETEKTILPNLNKAKDGDEHTECGYFTYNELPFENHKDPLFKLILRIF